MTFDRSMTRLTRSAIEPSAERYFFFFCGLVFALYERKNQATDKIVSTMLPQAKRRLDAAPRNSCQSVLRL